MIFCFCGSCIALQWQKRQRSKHSSDASAMMSYDLSCCCALRSCNNRARFCSFRPDAWNMHWAHRIILPIVFWLQQQHQKNFQHWLQSKREIAPWVSHRCKARGSSKNTLTDLMVVVNITSIHKSEEMKGFIMLTIVLLVVGCWLLRHQTLIRNTIPKS